MRFFSIVISISWIFTFFVFADPQKHLNQGDQLARQLLNQSKKKREEAGPHPFSKGISKEANFSAEELQGKAQLLSQKNPAGQMIFESSESRPQVKIDLQKDPLMTGFKKAITDPLNTIGGEGTRAVETKQAGKDETLKCEEPGEDSLESCASQLVVKVKKIKIRKEWNGQFQYSKCSNMERKGHYLPCQSLRQAVAQASRALRGRKVRKNQAPLDPNIALNITVPYKACMGELASNKHRSCSYCTASTPKLPFAENQIKEVLLVKNPQKPIRLHMARSYFHVYNSGRFEYSTHPFIKIIYEEDSYEVLPDEWNSNCERLESRVDQGLCHYSSKECTQGPQTRIIEGVSIKRDCWQEKFSYACAYPSKDDCGPLRARGCAQIHSACKQKVGNVCVVYTQTYQCKGNTQTSYSITGGNTPFCLDGNCRDQSWEANNEMMSSLAQLSLFKDMQGKMNSIFKGDQHQCSKYILNFKDCCGSGKGWGKSVGLGGCSGNEKLLRKKRQARLCHYVGTYCAKKVLGKCVKKRSSFCCFGSKLLKAFQEQGRQQIGLSWGEPKHPLCRGFTIEEIQRIDFSKLDLREAFEDLMKNYSPQKLQGTGQKIGERLDTIKKGLVPNSTKQPSQRPEA